jgi:hypothetical protein
VLTEVQFLNAKVVSPYEYRQISDIKVGFMPRGLDLAYVEELAEILREGGKFYDNISVFEDGELIDGLHRLEAYKKANLLTILVQVWKCPKENRTALKIHLNSAHGKQLSRKEKQESYFNLIQENPEITDEQAAKVFAVTERTIRNWKPEALKQKRLSQEEVKKIQDLKEQGKTNTEIAKELEVEEGAIRHHIRKLESFPIYDPNSPIPGTSSPEPVEPSNVIKAPIEFKKPPVQKEVHVDPDYPDDDDEDEEDLDIEAPDEDKKVYTVVKKEPTLRDEWKITMEAILRISERADKLRSHLHEIVLPGEFELVLCGSLQKAQNFLSYLREFVPEDTTIPNERR